MDQGRGELAALNTSGSPPADLLEESETALRRLGLLGPGEVRWSQGRARHSSRSVVIPLRTASGPVGPVEVFYKQARRRSGTPDQKWETRQAATLRVTREMEGKLSGATTGTGISLARTLAIDPVTLRSISLAVPGRPLGALWRRAVTPSQRSRAHEAVRLVGTACRLIDDVCRHQGELESHVVGEQVVERRSDRLRGVLGEETLSRVRALMTELEEEAHSGQGMITRAHGDLNATNVLVHDLGVSLIDFAWRPQLRLSDLSHFAFRLEYERGSPVGFARSLVGTLLDGYGDETVSDTAAWRFLRLSKLIRVVQSAGGSPPRSGGRARRALAEIEGMAGLSTR